MVDPWREKSAGKVAGQPIVAEQSCWFAPKGGACRGAVVLVHGLNQRPSSWQDMIDCLTGLDLNVYRLTLQGHGGNGDEAMRTVNAALWQRELLAACENAERHYPKVPRYFVGFSLGCLLAMTVQLRIGKPLFSAQLLLAPALQIHDYTRVVLPLTHLIPQLPSRSASRYVANGQGVTAQAYQALFDLAREFNNAGDLAAINVPTRVLMRKSDELVSYGRTARMIGQSRLDRWRVSPLPDDAPLWRRLFRFQHLVVDSGSAGVSSWQAVTNAAASLFGYDRSTVQNLD